MGSRPSRKERPLPVASRAMSLIVQKFGGTSVASADHIKKVAARIATAHRAGHEIVAVVSAMGSMTDELSELASQVSPEPPAREMDMLLTAGERISMALLAMALDEEQVEAVSLTGSQAGILTMGKHGSAEITEVRSTRVREGLEGGKVVIVAGFQGVDPTSKDVTTLGRGGSDVTAVALAAAHGAEVCEIYKDVDGVFTADPAMVPEARLRPMVSYREMEGLSAGGSQVLMGRAVQTASRAGIPIHIRSSYHENGGTWVSDAPSGEEVCGIAHDEDVARVTLTELSQSFEEVMEALRGAGITPDVVISAPERGGELRFCAAESRAKQALEAVEDSSPDVMIDIKPGLGKVSVVGEGVPRQGRIAAAASDALAEASIMVMDSAETKGRLTFVVERPFLRQSVHAVHDALGLGTSSA